MKQKQMVFIFWASLAILYGCQNNPLKINETKLSEEILRQEKEEAGQLELERKLADSLQKLPPGYRFNEDRSVDPARPPVVIDLAGNLNNVAELNLSDVASNIRYIRLEKVPDTGFSRLMKFKYYMTDDQIIAVNPSGILLYGKGGNYLATVVKNDFTGMEITGNSIVMRGDNTFVGGGTTVWISGTKLYYKYRNSFTAQSYIMEYDCSQSKIAMVSGFDPEKPRQIRGQGEPVFDLNRGKINEPVKGRSNSMWGMSADYLYQKTGTIMLDRNCYAEQMGSPTGLGGKYMMAIFNRRGDTLATFTQFERLKGYSKSLMRGTDFGNQYEIDGSLFIRNSFNDTVFKVVPPNRLLPLYVLNLGKWKLSKKEGVDPDFDLTGKIIPGDWVETSDHIFLSFTKDSYDCSNTRKSKRLKQYHAIYSKQTRKLSVVKGDPFNYEAEILSNNIDGGVPVWPRSYMIGKNGEILVSLKGKDLKERVASEMFKSSRAPADRKNELIRLAGSVSDDEDILMIVH